MECVLSLMDDVIAEWFRGRFSALTEPQAYAIPLIHQGKSVLVSSPTGSGKTLTAFLSIINELYILGSKGMLEDKIYCLYISPLRALANDINRNLREPLLEIEKITRKRGREPPKIRVAVRSGDTPASKRSSMSKRPPHLFITTPESFSIILSTPKFREKFRDVKYVIVDEIHEICSSKRGTMLALSLERLRELVGRDFVRIGLSATQAPIEEIAKFLVGYDDSGRLRDVYIVDVSEKKKIDVRVVSPVADVSSTPFEIISSRMYDVIVKEVEKNRTTLIFTNTRSGTESVVYRLKERGLESIAAHHGSLSREIRWDVEESMKNGRLRAVVSSTSLELGIDIGYIDLVCQIGSPKSVAKGIQRIGRAGHAVHEVPRGLLIPLNPDDLVECAVLARCAAEHKIDRVSIPKNCLDVLAQSLVGMSLEKRWRVEDAYRVVKRAYPYHDLEFEKFMEVLRYLGRETEGGIYSKLWYDSMTEEFGRKRGVRMIYYLNSGTIPEESNYSVITERGMHVGKLSEKFVERLTRGDIFVLGGRTYEFIRTRGMKVIVRDASGRRPTVPSWTGEMLPRSFDLSLEIGKFRQWLVERLKSTGEEGVIRELVKKYRVDYSSAISMVNYFNEQIKLSGFVPTHRRLAIEGYIDNQGRYHLIFHYPFGRRVNDALSRAYAYAISKRYRCNVRISITDDSFMLSLSSPVPLEGIHKLVTKGNFEDLLRNAIKNTELFKQRFRHCASRALMILRNYKGKDISVSRQQSRAQRVMEILLSYVPNHPVIEETYNEILHEVMDVENAKRVIGWIEEGTCTVEYVPYTDLPSPFAHNVILVGMSDIVLLEDRSALLRELHARILQRVMPELYARAVFDRDKVRAYFESKVPRIKSEDDIISFLRMVGAANLLQQKGVNVFDYAVDHAKARKCAINLISSGRVVSITRAGEVLWCLREDLPLYASIYAVEAPSVGESRRVLEVLKKADKPLTAADIAKKLGLKEREVMAKIKPLEQAYLVGRIVNEDLKALWYAREAEKATRDRALREVVCRLLSHSGPLTVDEVAYFLRLDREEALSVLENLRRDGVVVRDYYLPGAEMQYMLLSDYNALMGAGEASDDLESYWAKKYMGTVGTIKEYFDIWLEAWDLKEIHARVQNFSIEELENLLDSGAVLYGCFGGYPRFVSRKYAALLCSAYAVHEISSLESRVYNALGRGLSTPQEVARNLGISCRDARNAIESLEKKCLVVRRPEFCHGGKKCYRYIRTPEDILNTKNKNALEHVALSFIKRFAPLPESAIRFYLNLSGEACKSLLDRMESEGKVKRVIAQDRGTLYATADYPEEIKGRAKKVVVISKNDPYAHIMRHKIEALFGGEATHYVVGRGEILGALHVRVHEAHIDIGAENFESPAPLMEAVHDLLDYYQNFGIEIARLRTINGEAATLSRLCNSLLRSGYRACGPCLVIGESATDEISQEERVAYVFLRQHIHPRSKYADGLDAIREMGGLRNDDELDIRSEKHHRMSAYLKNGSVYRTRHPFGLSIFAPKQWILAYRAVLSEPLDDDMKLVVKLLESGPMTKEQVCERSPLGYGATYEALRKLYNAIYAVKDGHNRYLLLGDAHDWARDKKQKGLKLEPLLEKAVEELGCFTLSELLSYTYNALNPRNMLNFLRKLEKEGKVIKGFIVQESDELYWALNDYAKDARKAKFDEPVIIPSGDRIYPVLSKMGKKKFDRKFNHLIFLGGKLVGAFEGRMSRWEIVVKELYGGIAAHNTLRRYAELHRRKITRI